ncbi:MAG: hypothetical protein KGI25_09020 [Thaumarchaeota archaeon]|nr:hypothetical protein [Nitrososphaerota archaeon]
MKKAFLTESSRETNPLTKTLYKSLAATFVNAELISSWIELSLVAINNLGKAVDNVPSKQEFNSTRKELLNTKSIKRHTQRNQRLTKNSR